MFKLTFKNENVIIVHYTNKIEMVDNVICFYKDGIENIDNYHTILKKFLFSIEWE